MDLMVSDVETAPPECRETVEEDGRIWDLYTGHFVSHVYVQGYNASTKPTYSRYSRRARFFSKLLEHIQYDDPRILTIMKKFDYILKKWQMRTKSQYPRVYFLNIRCLLFLITTHLGIPPPFKKTECLRDMKRFRRQKKMFSDFVC